MASVEKQSRILIWAAPRSLSTGFLRAMFNRTRTKVRLMPLALSVTLFSWCVGGAVVEAEAE